MRGLQKSKRVSWASDLNLCQVKLFLSDESPSQVGLGGQDHLQAKASWPWHSGGGGAGSDDNLPPGFEGVQPASLLQNKLSQVPLIQWKCPSRFALDPNWQVAAGEESKEVEVESQREMRVLEAVYPRPSAIPPNPATPMGTDDPYYSDHHTPLIPITPIEDEDVAPDPSSTPANLPPPVTMASQSSNGGGTVEPDVVSAAYSALNAAMSNGSQGSLIDPNLLIKILSNPSLIEKLVSSTQGPSTSGPQISQPLSMPPASPAEPPPPPPPVHSRTTHIPFSTASSSSSNPHYPPPTSRVGPGPGPGPVPVSNLPPPPPPPEKKDINYYKSLIQQHGGEKAEAMSSNNNNNSNNNLNNNSNNNNVVKARGDTKGKVMKPCIYYNSPRGCRHGANCVFQHDSSSSSSLSLQQQQQQQRVSSGSGMPDSKRMKMDSREISGT